jgi:hypothetical protein
MFAVSADETIALARQKGDEHARAQAPPKIARPV